MGKVLKTIGKVVTFVGLAVATIATAGGAAIIAGAIGVAAGTLSTALTIGGAVLSTIGGALSKGPRLEDSGAEARGTAFFDANAVGAFVFGETAVPSALVFEQNHGADKELISNVVAHAWHLIESFEGIYVEGEAVSFSGGPGAGGAATGAFAGILTWHQRRGFTNSSAISLAGTVWPSTAQGHGIAHSALVWNFKDQDKLSGGVPSRVLVKVKGALCYDPRLDTSIGGSGAHRYDDPGTWSYSDNAALVALRYIIGERGPGGKLIWGVGDAQGDVDLASFIAAANVADELRDGVARYKLGGFFPTTNDHEAFFTQWEASTGGRIARVGGKRFCWLPHDDLTPAATITESDFVADSGASLRAAGELSSIVNSARGRYIDPSTLFQGAAYPEVEESSLIADDGGPRILSIDFGWVQVQSIAERIARYAIRRSRFGRIWRVAVGWQGALYPPFTVLTLNCRETNFDDQLVRVIDKSMSVTGVTILTLQEEDASIYDDTLPLGLTPPPLSPAERVDRLGTLTPRYIDGTRVDVLRPDAAGATRNEVTSGEPDPTGGVDGDLYYETDAQRWWARLSGIWRRVSDATAAHIAAGIAGQGALATQDTADYASDVTGVKPPGDATRNEISAGTPNPTGGVDGDLYYETDAQRWWSRIAGVWTPVADTTAVMIAAGIAGQGALATVDAVNTSQILENAGVSPGATAVGTSVQTTSTTFVDVPPMSGLTRTFDEDAVAMIMFYGVVSLSSEGGDRRIFTRLEDVHPGQGIRILGGTLTHTHFKANGAALEERQVFGMVAARMDAGTHTLNLQWRRLGAGTATMHFSRLSIMGFKGASFSGITGNPSDSGGGAGVGGDDWTGGALP